jgi:omega-hydroxy-beta-dihydromenaquinone-9 sulfotransferase
MCSSPRKKPTDELLAASYQNLMLSSGRSPPQGMRTESDSSCLAETALSERYNPYRFYTFRIWYGMVASAWLALLARNRFAVSPGRILFVLFGFIISAVHSGLSLVQTLIYGRRIRASVIEQPPIFIIGHWRTGTTFLHELLTLDERFTAPDTLECFAPADCLILDKFVRTFFRFVLPPKRPMDDMPIAWERPQEDEFALMNLGLRSPYEVVVFPNHRCAHDPFLDIAGLAPEQIEQWKAGFLSFLQLVNLRSKWEQKCLGSARHIVLKSPHHTARLNVLRDMFPDAKFVHLVRDPGEVFSSSLRFWRALFATQGCQKPDFGALVDEGPDIEQYVLHAMNSLYRNFFTQVAEIPAHNFCQVRYENLVRTPVDEMARIYHELQLGSFEKIRPKLGAYVRTLNGYKPNKHHISASQTAEVYRNWGWYMHRFGY